VFHLVPVAFTEGVDDDQHEQTAPQPALDVASLRKIAYAAAGQPREGTPSESRRSHFLRAAQVRAYVLTRAGGVCENCDKAAPFVTTGGRPYLEPHHIRRLSDGGPDDPRFMGAICPNCHREAHHGTNAGELNSRLQERIVMKEGQPLLPPPGE
jgi:5-methylcytosine-specific restriction protein A